MIHILSVIGRNPVKVQKILGPAEEAEVVNVPKGKYSLKQFFLGTDVEIVYIDNVADWITIHNTQDWTSTDFIGYFDLKDIFPDFTVGSKLQLKDVCGLEEISIFGEGDKIKKIHIKAFTKSGKFKKSLLSGKLYEWSPDYWYLKKLTFYFNFIRFIKPFRALMYIFGILYKNMFAASICPKCHRQSLQPGPATGFDHCTYCGHIML
jgi:hypothetical protein